MKPNEVLRHFGTWAAVANALDIKPPSVSEWVTAGTIPIGRQCQIEILTGGALIADRKQVSPKAAQ
jgi:hypothetical protein